MDSDQDETDSLKNSTILNSLINFSNSNLLSIDHDSDSNHSILDYHQNWDNELSKVKIKSSNSDPSHTSLESKLTENNNLIYQFILKQDLSVLNFNSSQVPTKIILNKTQKLGKKYLLETKSLKKKINNSKKTQNVLQLTKTEKTLSSTQILNHKNFVSDIMDNVISLKEINLLKKIEMLETNLLKLENKNPHLKNKKNKINFGNEKVMTGTIVGASAPQINDSNVGHQMLLKMGWAPGSGLGENSQGIVDPITVTFR
ncbi:hypothetical protein HK099_002954, partial [Clydaea vesicula]